LPKHKILVVDDEAHVLDGVEDVLRKQYEVHKAASAEEGIAALERSGPFAVVISDMAMPDVDGTQFLAEVRERFRFTVRILLTGKATVEAASRAVNEAGVWRFLTKPCSAKELLEVLQEACTVYQKREVEEEMLQTTLFSSMEVMSEVLSIVNPIAFSRGNRIRNIIVLLAKPLKLQEPWRFEVAAMLSQLGCVTLPMELLEKVYTRSKLSEDETKTFKSHPESTYHLLHRIPHLEQVALMIRNQNNPEQPHNTEGKEDQPLEPDTLMGARLLFLAGLYEDLRMAGASRKQAIEKLHSHFRGKYGVYIDALAKIGNSLTSTLIPKTVSLDELVPGMILSEDLYSDTGTLLMTKGQRITSSSVGRLMGFDERIGVKQPFCVMAPK
jgi:CheY-like chemotaxis protein